MPDTDPKNGRRTDGTFTNGNPGKPHGARHKATQAALALIDSFASQGLAFAIDMALAGDTVALRLCLERLAPPARMRLYASTCRPWKARRMLQQRWAQFWQAWQEVTLLPPRQPALLGW